jgi:hypothetical protein
MQGDASGGEAGNGRKAGALLRRAILGLEHWTDPDAVLAVIGAATNLQTRAISRLRELRVMPAGPEPPDEYIGIHELARLINRSISWIRHQPPDAIPGRRQHCEGGRVEWSRRAVQRWIEACTLQGT